MLPFHHVIISLMDTSYINTILVGSLVIITMYYAYQTHRQAKLLNDQLKTMAEQRRKSIQPSLQVNKISYWYQISEISSTHKKAFLPNIELQISNVGTGPALDLRISASATIRVIRGNSLEGNCCEFFWELVEISKDSYLEHTLKPLPFRLNLMQVNKIPSEKVKREMHIRFNFSDIDRSPLTELKIIHLGSDISPLRFEADEPKAIPGDGDYPENILIST